MPNTYKNKVVYNGTTLIDLTADTAIASDVAAGKYFHLSTGERVAGTASGGTSLPTFAMTISSLGQVTSITCDMSYAQCAALLADDEPTANVAITLPDSSTQTWGACGYQNYGYLWYVVLEPSSMEPVAEIEYNSNGTIEAAVPPTYIQSLYVTQNGTYSGLYRDVEVSVSGGTYQAKTNISPSTSSQTITPDAGYDALSSVQINSMPSGTAGTPSATKGTVSNHSVSVTPSVTNTTGYITGGTKTGTAVSVSASELVSGTLSITSSGTKDVTNYASASVAAGGATASATKGSVSNHSVTVTPSVTRTAGYVTAGTANGTAVTVSASELVSGSETKTENGTYDVTNLASLIVDVSGGSSSYTRTVVVPQQTVTPNSSRMATFTSTEYFADGEYYVVTMDGTEYIVTSETLWSNNVVLGDAQVVWATSDVLYPFALITDGSAREGYFTTTSQHTIKVEHLEFVDGPLNLIAKSVTANGTYTASSDNADGYSSVTVNVSGGGSPTLQSKTATPTTSQQVIQPDSGYDGLSQVTVNAIPSQYIIPSGNKAITANGTGIDVAEYATVSVNVSGSSKNVQVAQSTTRVANTAYTKTASLTCSKSGTYDVYWDCFRSSTSTSGTNGSQLYIGGSAYGSANTTFSNNIHAQSNHLTGVTINANQEVAVYVRSRATNYYAYCGQLTIVQTA